MRRILAAASALVLLALTLAMWRSLVKSGDKRLYKLN